MKMISRNLLRGILALCMTVVCLTCIVVPARAESVDTVPYTNYTYWETYGSKTPVTTKAVFQAFDVITGDGSGIGSFSELQYMCVYDGFLYVLDSANGRIVKYDKQYRVVDQITGFTYGGEELTFKGAKGIFVDETGLYVADTQGKRVLCTRDGVVTHVITKPDDTAVTSTFNFAPTRLIRDRSGYYYVLCEGSYYGMMVFTDKYEFCGFFGANSVSASLGDAVTEFISGLFDTEVKHSASVQALPYTMLDVCIDSDGFIVTINDEKWSGQIRRYGLSGTNILKKPSGFSYSSTNSFNFADNPPVYRDTTTTYGTYIYCAFNAITCDENGFYYVVDGARGRIYVYDMDINLIGVFGGGLSGGNQLGTFVSPSSVAVFGDDLLVADFSTGRITVFRKTDYGKTLMQADDLTVDSHYLEAKPLWEQVHAQDKNCQLAYIGLAKAYLEEGDYENAMEYAKMGYDKVTYAKAFEQVRDAFIYNNFWWILLVVIGIVGALAAFMIISRRQEVIFIHDKKLKIAMSTLAHPIASFNEGKQKKLFSVPIALCVLTVFYMTSVLKTMYGGFMYSTSDLSQYNAFIELIGTVGIVVLWTAANWLCCSLFEGKGDMKEIFCVSCYALMPVILYNVAYLALSNFLIPTNNSGFELFSTICYGLTVVHLLLGMTIVHDFSFFKSLALAAVILLGMFVIAFVIFVMLSLSQNLLNFVVQIFNEITMR
jgi:hypothetical protein